MKKLFLKDQNKRVIRAFLCEAETIYLLYRKKTGRLDFCSSPEGFEKEKNAVVLIDQFKVANLQKAQPVPLLQGFLEACDEASVSLRRRPAARPSADTKSLWRLGALVSACCLVCIGLLYGFSRFHTKERIQAPEQRVVTIIKPPTLVKPEKVVIGGKQKFLQNSPTPTKKKKALKKSLKKMGALSALGSLSKKDSKQRGGLNLGASKFSFGPGLRAPASQSGSGGVQSSLYSKGMITASLGSGGNIRGGGGYGTKGTKQGGGSAGYGKLALIGSGGAEGLSFSSKLDSQGGSFDFSLIEREIIKNIGSITLCYDEALKTEPDLKGLFKVSFSLNPQGMVVFSKRRPSSGVRSAKISSCILKVIRGIKFPIKLTSVTNFDYDFDLSALDMEGGP